jgi:hypothetical protein
MGMAVKTGALSWYTTLRHMRELARASVTMLVPAVVCMCVCSYTADDSTVHRIVLVAYEADDEDASVPAGLGVFRVVEQ